jgi:hypothetical protein
MGGHFACIGLHTQTREEFMAVVDRIVDAAVEDAAAPPPARHLRWTDASGASMAIHFSDRKTIECVTPFFVAPEPALWHVRTGAPVDDGDCAHCGGADCGVLDERGEMATQATVQWLHFQPFRQWLCQSRVYRLRVVVFAERAAFYPSVEAFDAGQKSWGWGVTDGRARLADCSFIPEGMFGDSRDLAARARCMFAGRVEAVGRPTNALSGRSFLHARVASLPGAIDFVADGAEGTAEAGAIALVRGWAVGRPEVPVPDAAVKTRGWVHRILGN